MMSDTLKAYFLRYPWSLRFETAKWYRHQDVLLNIEERCYPPALRSSPQDLQSLVEHRDSHFYVIFDAETAIGYISAVPLLDSKSYFDPDLDPLDHWQEGNTVYVHNIALLPEHRGRYEMQFTMTQGLNLAYALGYRFMAVHARISNSTSRYLQRKFGFIKLGERQDWSGTGEDFDYLMQDLCEKPKPSRCLLGIVTLIRRLFNHTRVESFFR